MAVLGDKFAIGFHISLGDNGSQGQWRILKIEEGVPAESNPRIYGGIGRKEGERGFERLL